MEVVNAALSDKFDDDDYPAYTMGRAAEILGVTAGLPAQPGHRQSDRAAALAGGHRRYSRYQLRLAARARQLVDQGTPLEAACRIIVLEDQLDEALRLNAELQQRHQASRSPQAS